ncbi:MAG TPA: hypothetical protein VGC13_08705 [Longimicrobium sp.]|jgi:uncharacterized membrane protein|uniref:hypothetical protein n=1 Tax=Longimicrobium sp. TaxID=2029185 RepID=UPI002ED969CE
MRWLNRLAAGLAGAITGMSILLVLILAGSVGLAWFDADHGAFPWALLLGGFGAGLAWPLFALITAAMLVLLVAAGVRAALRTTRRGSALLLGATALHAAWLFGIRPPAERTGVFTGKFVYGHMGFRPDYLHLCDDPTRPLPRGSDLVKGALPVDFPLLAAIYLPEDGWHGSHPRDWPSTESDSHGTRHWLVRMRGTLKGPGQYGRPGLMPYRLDVDSVVSVGRSRMFQDECGVYDPPPDWLPRR